MIFVGIGANLSSPVYGLPLATCTAAIDALEAEGLIVSRRSRWYASAPVPASDQPDFVNGVVEVETTMAPDALLRVLHEVERAFGRRRGVRNAARVLDLDLLAYYDLATTPGSVPEVPHPRMHQRLFVLQPLADLAPGWRHPRLKRSAADLLAALAPGQMVRPLESARVFQRRSGASFSPSALS